MIITKMQIFKFVSPSDIFASRFALGLHSSPSASRSDSHIHTNGFTHTYVESERVPKLVFSEKHKHFTHADNDKTTELVPFLSEKKVYYENLLSKFLFLTVLNIKKFLNKVRRQFFPYVTPY